MDIDEIRIQATAMNLGPESEGHEGDSAVVRPGTPSGKAGRPPFCMPSAYAIADAIIRRTLTDLRA